MLETFTPAWWLPGAHLQTLGARMLRSRRGVRLRRERLEAPDGDFLDLDWVEVHGTAAAADPDRRPLVVVLHGLEGSAESKYALEMYRALARAGLAAVGLNFRSCSGELNRLARLYHSGETDDLRWVLRVLQAREGRRGLGAVGFSLGGNVLLKYLGEEGPRQDGIRAAGVISVPYDLSAGADHIERGLSPMYRFYLLRKLQRKVRAKARLLEPHLDVARALAARTFREFDDVATAPLHGFAGVEDYYARASADRFLSRVETPTLLVHAFDDPFLPASAVPVDAVRGNPVLETRFFPRGGHVGFVTGPPWAPVFWAEREVARWLAARLGPVVEEAAPGRGRSAETVGQARATG